MTPNRNTVSSLLSIKFITLALGLVLFSNLSIAQDKILQYFSPAEKQQFSNLHTSKDLFRLALLAHGTADEADGYIQQVVLFIQQVGWSSTDHNKPNKRLKQLFKEVHKSFLRRYEDTANMNDMFKNGTYQCVSASVLYSYILESLSIPYQIKELPQHVFVIAYPESFNIMIETTNPTRGVFAPNTKGQEQFLNSLVKSKYLDQEYIDQVGKEKAFNEFFYGKTNITFQELVGILYFNEAIDHLEKMDKTACYSAAYKANELYPAKKHEYLQYLTLGELTENSRFENLDDWEAGIVLVNTFDREYPKDLLKHKFSTELNRCLFKTDNRAKIDSIYEYLYEGIKDAVLAREISETYLQESARSYLMARRSKEAIPLLERALEYSPTSPLIRSMLLDGVIDVHFKGNPTPQKIKEMDSWAEKYPFIKDDNRIHMYYLYNHLNTMKQAFDQERYQHAAAYYGTFLDAVKKNAENRDVYLDQIIYIFQHLGFHYMVNNKKEKAREVLNDGLALYPDNEKLQMALTQLKTYK